MKILLEEPETGLMTALFRWQPGAELALHEHVEIEQTFVIEGSLVDDEGEVTAGNYVWRPKGNRHIARSPNGALVLSMFLGRTNSSPVMPPARIYGREKRLCRSKSMASRGRARFELYGWSRSLGSTTSM
jgi:hypothetical protein